MSRRAARASNSTGSGSGGGVRVGLGVAGLRDALGAALVEVAGAGFGVGVDPVGSGSALQAPRPKAAIAKTNEDFDTMLIRGRAFRERASDELCIRAAMLRTERCLLTA
jgi:hypothetical protein